MKILYQAGTLLVASALVLSSGCTKTKRINHYPDLEVPQQFEVTEKNEEQSKHSLDKSVDEPAESEFRPNEKDVTGTTSEGEGGEGSPRGTPMEQLSPIHFDLDADKLTTGATETLITHADFLKQNPDLHVVIRGHTDSSGTDEYNLSLGSRRAQAVRDRLVELGIEASRLETVSYGENLPLVEEDDDVARAKNRRAEFFVYTMQ